MFIFVIQIFSSFLIIVFVFLTIEVKDLFFLYAFVIKIAFFPVYYWYFLIFFLLNKGIFFMLTFQKLFVFIIMSSLFFEKLFIFFIFGSLLVVLLNLTQNFLKIIIIFSRLFHTIWISFSFFIRSFLYLFYFFVYTLTLWYVILYFIKKNCSILFVNKFNIILLLLSISRIPPFLVFIPKLYVVYFSQSFFFILFFFILFTLINITLYLRILFFMIIGNLKYLKEFFVNKINVFYLIFFNFFFLLLI